MADDKTLPAEVVEFVLSEDGAAVREDLGIWFVRYRTLVTVPDAQSDPAELVRQLFFRFPEFRSLLDVRLRACEGFGPDYRYLTQHRRGTELHFNVKRLGGGCFVQHGTGTWIFAREIGRNFFVNQNVTIGQGRRGGSPMIGDNVSVRTGAVVVGPITIGSNAFIGANAVVNFDVPEGRRVYAPRPIVVLPGKDDPAGS